MDLAEELKISFSLLIAHWRFLSQQLEEVKTEMLGQSFEDAENEAIYRSVPGIGIVSARTLSNELGDLSKRFKNQNALFQFLGLTRRSSLLGKVSGKARSVDRVLHGLERYWLKSVGGPSVPMGH